MKKSISRKILEILVLVSAPLTTLFITPTISADPFNVSKMLILVPISFGILGLSIVMYKESNSPSKRIFVFLLGFFVLQMLLVLFISGSPFVNQIFGVDGRRTGFLTYLGLSSLALGAFLVINIVKLAKLSVAIIATGVVSAIYGLIQNFNLDPIEWANPYNNIVGFLGNPNFQSSFLGMTGSCVFALLLKPKLISALRVFAILYIGVTLFLIKQSNSQQGFLVFGFSSLVVGLIFLLGIQKFRKRNVVLPITFLVFIATTITVLGTLNHGPLGEFLYKSSVRQRGFYWHAALEMIKSHPLFGVGMDSYGDWYFELRSKNAGFYSPTATSNSAHNVFLDLGSNGGVPLLLMYVGIVGLAIWSVFKYLKANKDFNWAVAGVIGTFVGYLLQSFISINQIGLAVWGWILLGALIGLNSDQASNPTAGNITSLEKKGSGFKASRRSNGRESKSLWIMTTGFAIGLALAFPAFKADVNFRKAASSTSANEIIAAALAYPESDQRTITTVTLLARSNLLDQARTLTDHVLKKNPRFYSAWELKYQLTDKSSKEFEEVLASMAKLNPNAKIGP
jgi:O-antigen ligase